MATFRLTVVHSYAPAGGPGINTFHFRTGGGIGSNIGLVDFVESLRVFYAAIASIYPTASSLRMQPQAVDVATDEIVVVPTWLVQGTSNATGGYLPTISQICLNWRTSSATRSGRGRTFLGPLSTGTAESNGTPTLVAATTITNAAQALIAASSEGEDGSPVVYSTQQGLARDITAGYVRDQFASLRSRRD